MNKQFAIGFFMHDDIKDNINLLKVYNQILPGRIHDVHFAHYDNSILSSGRFINKTKPETMFSFIEQASDGPIRLTLLMNYLIEKDYDKVLTIFDEYYRAGLRSTVIADLELIKRIKQKYPDVYIQGSCLSYRITEEELEEEAKEGVELHNPGVDIIRMPDQLKANHNAGFKQKVLFAEGCLHSCPHERKDHGHRWCIARGEHYKDPFICTNTVSSNVREFFTANWVTIQRLRQLEPYIEVIKLPRGHLSNAEQTVITGAPFSNIDKLLDFITRYDNNLSHSVLEYNAVAYGPTLKEHLGYVDSTIFDDAFWRASDNCKMQCEKRNCNVCYEYLRKIEMSQPQGRTLRKRNIVKY